MPQPQHPSRAHSEEKHSASQSRSALRNFHDSSIDAAPVEPIVDQPNMRGKRWVGRSGGQQQAGRPPVVAPFFAEQESILYGEGDVGPLTIIPRAGQLFIAGYSDPAYILRHLTPTTDLANYDGQAFLTPEIYAIGAELASDDRIYMVFQDNNTRLRISRIHPVTLAVSTVVDDITIPLAEGNIGVSPTHLFAVTGNQAPNVLHKYDLATFAVHTSVNLGIDIQQAHCVHYNGTNNKLFITAGNSNGIARVNPTTLAIEQSINNHPALSSPFKYVVSDATYVYVTNFGSTNLARILQSDMNTYTLINLGADGAFGDGMCINGTNLYVVCNLVSKVVRVDLITLATRSQTLAHTGATDIAFMGGFYYVTTATTPSRITRYTEQA